MSITKTAKGYRAQVYDPRTRKNVSVSKVLGGSSMYPTKNAAKAARENARTLLAKGGHEGPTLAAFAYRWRTDRLFARPKQSTDLQNHWAVKEFVDLYGALPIRRIDHDHVAEYLAGGKRSHRIQGLRTMFNDAASQEAGRLVDRNPFTGLKLSRGKGNRHNQPPSEAEVWAMIRAARVEAGPSFSAWLQVACFTGLRPGELDALRWQNVNLRAGTIQVVEQFNARTRTFTLPKNGETRTAILTGQARDALMALPRTSEFCFPAPRGGHYTPAARRAPWKRTRDAIDWTGSLYLATRHFAGSFMVNVLQLDSEDVAYALGHEDGGEQVRKTYGHRERTAALKRVADAYRARPAVQLAKEA